MQITPNPHYFIVRIEFEKQNDKREKIGSFFLHFNEVNMERNLQCGEVVAIGSEAHKNFPEAKVGDTMLLHHFVEGHRKEGVSNLVISDEEYNYYYVNAEEYNGHRIECYGIYSAGKITPHPEFVFVLPEEKKESEVDLKELGKEIGFTPNIPMTKSDSGLLLFSEWEQTREQKELKATILLNEVKHGSKGKNLSDSVRRGLEEKQLEAGKITASLNQKKYIPYTLAAYHPSLQKGYNGDLKEAKKVYCLNIGAMNEFEFMDKTYIIVQKKYVAAACF